MNEEENIFRPRIQKKENGLWLICDGRRLVKGDSLWQALFEYIRFVMGL